MLVCLSIPKGGCQRTCATPTRQVRNERSGCVRHITSYYPTGAMDRFAPDRSLGCIIKMRRVQKLALPAIRECKKFFIKPT